MKWLYRFLIRFRFFRHLIEWSKRTSLPGFDKVPVFNVSVFFINELQKEALNTKATSLAYSFLLALFPATIFLFTLIPYIPVADFQDQLLLLLKQLLPKNAYQAFSATLEDIIRRQRGDLLSLGFVFALFFSTNGVFSLMKAFNKSALQTETRSFLRQRLVAVSLTFLVSSLLLVGISVIVAGEYVIDLLNEFSFFKDKWLYYLVLCMRWVIIIILFFGTISVLYYFGPSTPKKFKFISAGSTLATILFILTSVGFSYYINHFSRYNKLYGSIGTLIVVMLWLYLSSMILLIGFELNASIALSKKSMPPPPKPPKSFSGNRLKTEEKED